MITIVATMAKPSACFTAPPLSYKLTSELQVGPHTMVEIALRDVALSQLDF
jgi:hypothetical protein